MDFCYQYFNCFLPAAMIGLFARDFIKAYLFNPVSVATALVIGGFIILYAEKRQHQVTYLK
jgi:undecaprenyl-diphosphatase